jgi:hypothetical protein
MVTGIIRADSPGTPRMADERSSVKAPMVWVVLTILKEFSGEARVATTSALVMGMETLP